MAPLPQPIAAPLSPPSLFTPFHGTRSEGDKVSSFLVVQSEVGGLRSPPLPAIGASISAKSGNGSLVSLGKKATGRCHVHASHRLDATTIYSFKNLCSGARFLIYMDYDVNQCWELGQGIS